MDTAAALRSTQDRPDASPSASRGGGSVTALVRPVEHPLGHLDLLESLAIFIIREVAAEAERPVLLFSGGKDSAVLLHLAAKAFKPGRIPFPVLHVDTGHNFAEVLEYRDAQVEAEGARPARRQGAGLNRPGTRGRPRPDRLAQPLTDDDAARRHQQPTGSMPPSAVRAATRTRRGPRSASCPSATRSGNGTPSGSVRNSGSSIKAACVQASISARFPLSDWTELDIWQYIRRERIELPSIYYAHEREVIERDGMLLALSEWVTPEDGETVRKETVRFRTVGDATCTGAVRSEADSVEEIIREVSASRISERGATRADDRFSETAMEDRKREGYF